MRAAEIFFWFFLNALIKERDDFIFRILHTDGALTPRFTPQLIEVLQVCNNQGVLRSEKGIEARLRHVSFTEDTINTDDANTFCGEKVGCAIEETLSGAWSIATTVCPGTCFTLA
ncbi:hypothetical protein C627_14510 [Corynebacterium glutamicum ZL-6]|nr:hypothetical protein C624_14520 [Corynebacterium glutamicum SCgG1]AGN23496.1 hypothetical protein C629_14530 [Corynebacterium glutamicum SCgG2]ANR63813.1 hypothetical protein C628_14645 [[Brevibacterium] flavum ZL-1]ANR66821.1 hypothetical protein C627_14510 [Corynebacterium glutamicum ZL-6]EGV39046.1 hypothetical protein CgS9114_15158 [Corynebacterium glutamicum S9114]EPP39439.1 hypothetical protein A583_14043 [Corynebacterium glutamicum Z188]PST74714.1 hypothetical protein I919_14689 [Co